MRCRFVRHLRAYVEEELPPEQREQLRQHLADCPECADELDGLQRVERLLAELSPAAAPAHLAPATLRRLRAQPSTPVLLVRRAPALAGVAAAAACLLMAAHVLLPNDSSPRPSSLPVVAPVEIVSPAAMVILAPARPAARPVALTPPAPVSVARPATRRVAHRPASPDKSAVKALPPPKPVLARSEAEARAVAALNAVRRRASVNDPDLMAAALENVALVHAGTAPAAQALLTAGDLQRQRGNLAEADANYRRLLSMKGTSRMPRALAHKALADLRAESVGADEVTRYHYREAARVLRDEAKSGAARPQALVAMADIARETGNRAEAVADYAAAANQGAGERATTSLAEVL